MIDRELDVDSLCDSAPVVIDEAARRHTTTYLTRHGHRVAAIVPPSLARPVPPPAEHQRVVAEPSAPGGKVGERLGSERTWTAAAVAALAARLADSQALQSRLQSFVAEMAAAVADRDSRGRSAMAKVEALADEMPVLMDEAGRSQSDIRDLVWELAAPDDLYCTRCRAEVIILEGDNEDQNVPWHVRQIPDATTPLGYRREIYRTDDHEIDHHWWPRHRAAIVDGRVDTTTSTRSMPPAEFEEAPPAED